jgi:hypothetical protein
MDASHFEALQNVLEHFAEDAAERLRGGAEPTVDPCVPIAAGPMVAECAFDDVNRRITVTQLERWDL